MILSRALLSLTCLLFLFSCTENRYEADTSNIEFTAEFKRLDQDLFALGSTPSLDDVRILSSNYDGFLDIYLKDIMLIGPVENPMTPPLVGQFVSDLNWKSLQNDIEEIHPSLASESEELEMALKRYAVFFGNADLPQLIAYNSGFNVGVYPSQKYLAVGLEWYSGSDLPMIDRLPPDMFPLYKRQKMDSQYLTVNALKGWVMVQFQDKLNGDKLLNRMVYAGKTLFLTEKLLKERSTADVFNYSEAQIAWCEDKALDIWKMFLENDLLFSEDVMQINKIVGDGPFTPGMPPESPGGVGNWVGYKLVSAYMEANKQVSLADLMAHKNDQEILRYYKP